ncbi:MAG: hypothetical protein ACXVNF_04470 [Neobacillus sp.]
MSTVRFDELLLISLKEKSARRINFDEKATVIYSVQNKTGKSSIIKSLYHTLGADTSFEPQWKEAEVITLLKFSVQDKKYSIMRNKKTFSIFDSNNNLIGKYSKIVDELAPVMANIIGYSFTLTDWNDQEVIPSPAYYFLPFYLDQDKGWQKNWSSFEQLSQVPKWEDVTTKYHVGILTDEYFELNRKYNASKVNLKQFGENVRSLEYALRRYQHDLNQNSFRLNIEDFQKDIEEMFEGIQDLQKIQDEQKRFLFNLYNEQLLLLSQKQSIETMIKGLEVDFDNIDKVCPTCGNNHESTFEARLKTAENEARCYQLLNETTSKLELVRENINKTNEIYKSRSLQIEDLHDVLNRKKGDLRVEEIIRLEGVRNFVEKIKNDLWEENKKLNDEEKENKRLKRCMAKIVDKNRQEEIQQFFYAKMQHLLNMLDLGNVKEDDYKNIKNKIKVKGSNLPRAVLAYIYSVLLTKFEKGNSAFCPIVIDSPKQQDQSVANYEKMIDVIFNQRPKNSQLILGVVDSPDIQFDGTVIKLENKHKVLEAEKFEEILFEIKPLLDKSLM